MSNPDLSLNAPTAEVLAAYQARLDARAAHAAYEFELDRQYEARQDALAQGGHALGVGDRQVEDARHKLDAANAAKDTAEAAVGGSVYRIHAENAGILVGQIAKLSKRAAKLDLPEPTLTFDGVEVHHGFGTPGDPGVNAFGERISTYRYAILTGRPVKLAGWEFVATLEHDTDTGMTLIRRAPGLPEAELDLTGYRHASAICEHCGITRNRKDTYLVRSETEGVRQVGSSCLKDFLGHGSPEQYARFAEALADLAEMLSDPDADSAERGGSRGPVLYDTAEFLAFCAVSIRTHGWVSRGQAGYGYGLPTADQTLRDLGRHMGVIRSTKDDDPILAPEQQDIDTAQTTLAWVRDELSAKGESMSDYEHNLVASVASDFMLDRRAGIAASAITAHARHLEREVKRAQRDRLTDLPDGGPFGQQGEKVQVQATVTRIGYHPGDYGTKTRVEFLDDEGHRFKWWASSDPDLNAGDRITIKGTVKDHGEWNGNAETTLTRCKVLEVHEPAEATA